MYVSYIEVKLEIGVNLIWFNWKIYYSAILKLDSLYLCYFYASVSHRALQRVLHQTAFVSMLYVSTLPT